MSNYKVGDIIVNDGYTYVCRIVGEQESYFEKRWFKGLFKNPDNVWGTSGCGGESFSCADNLILFSDKCKLINCKRKNAKDKSCGSHMHPVIGSFKECEPIFISLDNLRSNYKDDYMKYIEYLYNLIPKEDPIKDVSKKLKKKKK